MKIDILFLDNDLNSHEEYFDNEMIKEYLKSVWNFCREYPFYAVAFFYGGYLIGVVYF